MIVIYLDKNRRTIARCTKHDRLWYESDFNETHNGSACEECLNNKRQKIKLKYSDAYALEKMIK